MEKNTQPHIRQTAHTCTPKTMTSVPPILTAPTTTAYGGGGLRPLSPGGTTLAVRVAGGRGGQHPALLRVVAQRGGWRPHGVREGVGWGEAGRNGRISQCQNPSRNPHKTDNEFLRNLQFCC